MSPVRCKNPVNSKGTFITFLYIPLPPLPRFLPSREVRLRRQTGLRELAPLGLLRPERHPLEKCDYCV